MRAFHSFENALFTAGDRLSAFLYDVTGWHLRVIVLWVYILFNGPTIQVFLAGDRIDSPAEWLSVGITLMFGFTALYFLRRFPVASANRYLQNLRAGVFMMLLRVMAIAFLCSIHEF